MAIDQTFNGFVETTTDALLIFEACRRGILPKISRRLQEKERSIIRSGAVFVFDERESGIKRWTDGLVWSPSRILGNFLIYRELHGRQTAQQKGNPLSSSRSSFSSIEVSVQRSKLQPQSADAAEINSTDDVGQPLTRDRNLVGSLTDSYKFRKGGLIKKTISIHLNGSTQHLVSYYTKMDVVDCKLPTPSLVPELSALQISRDLLVKQSFRVPPSVEFAELMIKRPSLSPSSTNSTVTCCSTTTDLTRRISCNTDSAPAATCMPQSYYHHQQSMSAYPLSVNYFQPMSTEELGSSSHRMDHSDIDRNRYMPERSNSSFALPSYNYYDSNSPMRSSYSISGSYMPLENENDGRSQTFQPSKLIYSLLQSEYATAVSNNQPGYSNGSDTQTPSYYKIADLHGQHGQSPLSSAGSDYQLYNTSNKREFTGNTQLPAVRQNHATDYCPPSFSASKQSYTMDSSMSTHRTASAVSLNSPLPFTSSNTPLWYTNQPHKSEMLANTTLPYA